MSTETEHDFSAEYQQQDIKLKRKALLEYADNNINLDDNARQQFTMDILSNPAFFKKASNALEQVTAIMWAAALEDDTEEYPENKDKFLQFVQTEEKQLKDICVFFIQNWEYAFIYPTKDEDGEPIVDEQQEPIYGTILTPEQTGLCEERMLELQEQLA